MTSPYKFATGLQSGDLIHLPDSGAVVEVSDIRALDALTVEGEITRIVDHLGAVHDLPAAAVVRMYQGTWEPRR